MQAAIDANAMSAPERIAQLNQPCFGQIDYPPVDSHLLAPERPTFVKDRMGKKAPQPTGVLVLNDELKMMARVCFVSASELQSEMLLDFRRPPTGIPLRQAQIV